MWEQLLNMNGMDHLLCFCSLLLLPDLWCTYFLSQVLNYEIFQKNCYKFSNHDNISVSFANFKSPIELFYDFTKTLDFFSKSANFAHFF